MPFRRRQSSTRRPKRKSGYKRRSYRMGRRTIMPRAPTGSFASRAETYSIPATAGVVYDLNDLRINAQFTAAPQLAALYQYYRITSVQWRLKPNFDTYVAPGVVAGNPQLPYLYFLYDKAGSLGALNSAQFEACGAKPVRVDDKTILRKWKPTVRLNDAQSAVPMFKASPWMPTYQTDGITPNAPNHLGAVWYVSKMSNTDAQVYDIDVTVTFQFKKPLVPASQ